MIGQPGPYTGNSCITARWGEQLSPQREMEGGQLLASKKALRRRSAGSSVLYFQKPPFQLNMYL